MASTISNGNEVIIILKKKLQSNWNLLWQVDKDEDDPEFSSPGSAKQLPRRTHTDIAEVMLTQLSKVEGYGQILHQEFGCLAATPSAPAKGGGRLW